MRAPGENYSPSSSGAQRATPPAERSGPFTRSAPSRMERASADGPVVLRGPRPLREKSATPTEWDSYILSTRLHRALTLSSRGRMQASTSATRLTPPHSLLTSASQSSATLVTCVNLLAQARERGSRCLSMHARSGATRGRACPHLSMMAVAQARAERARRNAEASVENEEPASTSVAQRTSGLDHLISSP